jgi:hypothetical protein
VRNSLAARTLISTPRAGPSLTKASIERTTPLICGSQASVMMRMRINGNAGTYAWTDMDSARLHGVGDLLAWSPPTTAKTFNRSAATHRLGGRIREFREAAILIFSPRTGWLAWASRNFAAVILNGRPGCGRGQTRGSSACCPQSPALASCCYTPLSVISRRVRMCSLDLLKNAAAREVLIFTGGNY